jgi:hypothetical protein
MPHRVIHVKIAIPDIAFRLLHLSMQSRLYLHLSVLGTSSRLALLPCGIVVEPSGFPAWLLIAVGTTRYGFPAINPILMSTVLRSLAI